MRAKAEQNARAVCLHVGTHQNFRAMKVEGVECVIEEIRETTFISANRMCIQWPQSSHSSKLHQTLKIWPLLVIEKPTLSGGRLSRLATATGTVLGLCHRDGSLASIWDQRVACAALEGEGASGAESQEGWAPSPPPTPTSGSCQGGYCCQVITGLTVKRECAKL